MIFKNWLAWKTKNNQFFQNLKPPYKTPFRANRQGDRIRPGLDTDVQAALGFSKTQTGFDAVALLVVENDPTQISLRFSGAWGKTPSSPNNKPTASLAVIGYFCIDHRASSNYRPQAMRWRCCSSRDRALPEIPLCKLSNEFAPKRATPVSRTALKPKKTTKLT